MRGCACFPTLVPELHRIGRISCSSGTSVGKRHTGGGRARRGSPHLPSCRGRRRGADPGNHAFAALLGSRLDLPTAVATARGGVGLQQLTGQAPRTTRVQVGPRERGAAVARGAEQHERVRRGVPGRGNQQRRDRDHPPLATHPAGDHEQYGDHERGELAAVNHLPPGLLDALVVGERGVPDVEGVVHRGQLDRDRHLLPAHGQDVVPVPGEHPLGRAGLDHDGTAARGVAGHLGVDVGEPAGLLHPLRPGREGLPAQSGLDQEAVAEHGAHPNRGRPVVVTDLDRHGGLAVDQQRDRRDVGVAVENHAAARHQSEVHQVLDQLRVAHVVHRPGHVAVLHRLPLVPGMANVPPRNRI